MSEHEQNYLKVLGLSNCEDLSKVTEEDIANMDLGFMGEVEGDTRDRLCEYRNGAAFSAILRYLASFREVIENDGKQE